MTECRKVQELTKEFLKKLSKIQAFKERIVSLKSNNNFEYKRIRTKNNNNRIIEDLNQYAIISRSDNKGYNEKSKSQKKVFSLKNNSVLLKEKSKENEREKEKEKEKEK